MRERGIIFSGEMVRAILDGRKTQTRRVIKPQPIIVYRLTDDRIAAYHTDYEKEKINFEENTCFSERRLSSGERWEDLFTHKIQRLWEKGLRGLVSIDRALNKKRLPIGYFVPQKQKSNEKYTPFNLHGISWDAPNASTSNATSRRKSGEQSARKSTLGNASGELVRSESTRKRNERRKTSYVEIKRFRTGTFKMGDQNRPMQSEPCSENVKNVPGFYLRDCPYKIEQILWIRETFCPVDDRQYGGEKWIDYRATPKYETAHPAGWAEAPDDPEALKWKPSIFMPRSASRIDLEITGVRVERIQDITEADILAEGVRIPFAKTDKYPDMGVPLIQLTGKYPACEYLPKIDRKRKPGEPLPYTPEQLLQAYFASLWDTINAKRGFPWSANPWVWAIEFKRIRP